MASDAFALNRLPPAGQPAQMQDGEFVSAAPRPRLFGQGNRELFGVPKLIVVPNPLVGHEWTYAFSGPSWYLLRTAIMNLTTSAVAGNRGVALVMKYTGILCGSFSAVAVEVASSVFAYSIGAVSITTGVAGFVPIPTPDFLILKDGMSIGSQTVALDAGDQWSAIALFVEEFTDKCLDYL